MTLKASKAFSLSILSVASLWAGPGHANWLIHQLTNASSQIITVNVPVNAGAVMTDLNLNPRGNVAIVVPDNGVLSFEDKGQNTVCSNIRNSWWVEVTYDQQMWRFFYDGEGRVNVTINADGSATLANAATGVVIVGDGC